MDSRERFEFVTDLTVRGKQELRAMKIRFAQALYAEVERVKSVTKQGH